MNAKTKTKSKITYTSGVYADWDKPGQFLADITMERGLSVHRRDVIHGRVAFTSGDLTLYVADSVPDGYRHTNGECHVPHVAIDIVAASGARYRGCVYGRTITTVSGKGVNLSQHGGSWYLLIGGASPMSDTYYRLGTIAQAALLALGISAPEITLSDDSWWLAGWRNYDSGGYYHGDYVDMP
jgi:hypothetical protein